MAGRATNKYEAGPPFPEDELPACLKSVSFFDSVNQRMPGFTDGDFASWRLGELLRSRSIELKDGWILPTMAP